MNIEDFVVAGTFGVSFMTVLAVVFVVWAVMQTLSGSERKRRRRRRREVHFTDGHGIEFLFAVTSDIVDRIPEDQLPLDSWPVHSGEVLHRNGLVWQEHPFFDRHGRGFRHWVVSRRIINEDPNGAWAIPSRNVFMNVPLDEAEVVRVMSEGRMPA